MTTQDPSMPQDAHRPRTDEERAYYGLNQRVYAVFAPFYDLVAAPIRNVRKRVAALAGIDSHSRVLHVATGTGSQAHAFAEKAGEVIGIDLSEAMLRIARRKTRGPRVSFRQGDATDLPFPDGLLRSAGIDIQAEHYVLFGIVRIVVGSRMVNSSSGRTDKQA